MQDSIFTSSIQQFYSDPYINKLEQRLSKQFNNTQTFKVGIIDGFKHLKYHFPKGKIPSAVVFMNSLFRNIKENSNLDLLEESDDEDEDDFVYLDREYKMRCKYNKQFKKWIPFSLENSYQK
jgi:hypothetical protein